MNTYKYTPRTNSTKSLFSGTMAECLAHVAALKKNIKGYKYRIRGRGHRAIHVGKSRVNSKILGFSRRPYNYTFYNLSQSLPHSLSTHGVVYDNLNQLCNSR